MPAPHDHIVMGVGVSCVSLACLVRYRWVLSNTRKGQWLVERCGESTARHVFALACVIGAAFGSLLATGWIRPITW